MRAGRAVVAAAAFKERRRDAGAPCGLFERIRPMEQPVLSDANQFPSEDIVFSHLGKARALWVALFDHIHSCHPDFAQEWRYYRDGKSWLMKVTHKKKTIFWVSLLESSFRTTFYFTDRAEEALMSSNISDELKENYKAGKQVGKIKGITVVHKAKRDIKDAETLIGIKLRTK